MAYEKYILKDFRDAIFNGERSVIKEDEFKIVYNEYIDTSELYEKEEFGKTARIHYLNGRVNYIKIAIKLQLGFLDNFDIPYIKEFEGFKKYGHVLRWKRDKDNFLQQLKNVEQREERYEDEVNNEIKLLYDMRLKKQKKEYSLKESRGNFIRTFNSLGEIYHNLSWNTTVEDYSYMIKQQTDRNKKQH